MYMNHKTSFHGLIALLIIISVVVGLSACGATGKEDTEDPFEQSEDKLPIFSQDGNTLENTPEENKQVEPPVLLSQGSYEGYEYDLYEGYVSIRGYLGNDEELQIPSEIEGTKVTNIGESAFAGTIWLRSVKIPNTVTGIDFQAFCECYGLQTVDIPESVEYIGGSAFSDCTALEVIDLPPNIIEINNFAFYGCSSLKNIIIPDHVEFIGEGAFASCTSLANVEFPKNVSAIEDMAFSDTPWLNGLTGEYVVVGDGILIDYNGTGGVVDIPSGVKYISTAFSRNPSIIEVNIPDTTTSIGSFAFQGCSQLTTVSMPDAVTSIARCAFIECGQLCDIKISNSLQYLGESAFSNCSSLRSIILPDTLTELGTPDMYNLSSGIFANCMFLWSVILPKTLTNIPYECFSGCDKLASIVVPESVTSIGENAFEETQRIICPQGSYAEQYAVQNGLTYTTLSSDLIERKVDADFEYDVYPRDIEITRYLGDSLYVEIPSKIDGKNVISINEKTFCWGEADSVYIPATIPLIEEGAFSGLPGYKLTVQITCEKGSPAMKYAETHGIQYSLID